jgi:hypothetical protein
MGVAGQREQAGTRVAFDGDEGWCTMKRALVVALTDEELLELCRVLLDRDEKGALRFLDAHLGNRVTKALEGG